MQRSANPMTAEERYDMLKYAEEYGIKNAVTKYKCTEQTIYRWKRKFNGTIESLKDGSSRPLTPHPNALTDEEISAIKENVQQNPYITDGELVKILGTGRNRTVIRKYRDRLFGKQEFAPKSEVRTMFNLTAVEELNKKDIVCDDEYESAYLIEINDSGIYIGKDRNNGYPAYLTIYYAMAMKFKTHKEAQEFLASIENSSKYKLTIKEIKK